MDALSLNFIESQIIYLSINLTPSEASRHREWIDDLFEREAGKIVIFH
jgi:hypothetical protein